MNIYDFLGAFIVVWPFQGASVSMIDMTFIDFTQVFNGPLQNQFDLVIFIFLKGGDLGVQKYTPTCKKWRYGLSYAYILCITLYDM